MSACARSASDDPISMLHMQKMLASTGSVVDGGLWGTLTPASSHQVLCVFELHCGLDQCDLMLDVGSGDNRCVACCMGGTGWLVWSTSRCRFGQASMCIEGLALQCMYLHARI